MELDQESVAMTPDGGAEAGGVLARARPRVRILLDDRARIGPGKIDLLTAIAETGSISAAGRALGMSYRRTWLLATETDRLFGRPLVVTAAGGAGGGGARLTPLGEAVVAAYRRIEARTLDAIREELAPFAADLDADLDAGPRAPAPAPEGEDPRRSRRRPDGAPARIRVSPRRRMGDADDPFG